ncbi:MAG: hypothetical protein IJ856_01345, partial [Candidatus Methanomethylophilaceae archaeon]|nr:hypothetical protein [Candidatus Methanomethylophilaceae archaeon]
DVILFSIGYGPDSSGTVRQNFGPLNRDGGGRRLNVAVSRARMEMVVFTSMHYTDIRLTSTSGSGVKYLREFLRFAEMNGHFDTALAGHSGIKVPSAVHSLGEVLEKNGYDCHFNVGSSQFKVDVAVVDPDDPERYLLGILSDGDSYRNSDNTRDREYAREDVLKRLGWNLARVWSVDWYFDSNRVVKNIMKELAEIRSRKPVPEEAPAPVEEEQPQVAWEEPSEEKEAESVVSVYTPYDPPSEPCPTDVAVGDRETISRIAGAIVQAEGPVNETLLLKLYTKATGVKRLTEPKKRLLTGNLREIFMPTVEGDFVTYWPDPEDHTFEGYRVAEQASDNRDIDCIPLVELLNACVDAIERGGSVPKEAAVMAVSRALGFSRAGAKITDIVGRTIEIAVARGMIQDQGDRYLP